MTPAEKSDIVDVLSVSLTNDQICLLHRLLNDARHRAWCIGRKAAIDLIMSGPAERGKLVQEVLNLKSPYEE